MPSERTKRPPRVQISLAVGCVWDLWCIILSGVGQVDRETVINNQTNKLSWGWGKEVYCTRGIRQSVRLNFVRLELNSANLSIFRKYRNYVQLLLHQYCGVCRKTTCGRYQTSWASWASDLFSHSSFCCVNHSNACLGCNSCLFQYKHIKEKSLWHLEYNSTICSTLTSSSRSPQTLSVPVVWTCIHCKQTDLQPISAGDSITVLKWSNWDQFSKTKMCFTSKFVQQ